MSTCELWDLQLWVGCMHTNVEFVHGGGMDKNNGKKQAGGKFLKKYDGFETGWKVNFSQFSIVIYG